MGHIWARKTLLTPAWTEELGRLHLPISSLHLSALHSHDRPAAAKDMAYGYQCSMSSHPSKTVLPMVAHHDIIPPRAAITHTFPSGLDPWPNKHYSHSIPVHTYTHTRRNTSNWNKTRVRAEAVTRWFWRCAINPCSTEKLQSPSHSLPRIPAISHLFTGFHISDLVISVYLASNENISRCVWVVGGLVMNPENQPVWFVAFVCLTAGWCVALSARRVSK